MALYVGDGVTLMVEVVDPVKQVPITEDVAVIVDFFAPGKDPKNVPEDRTPDVPATAAAYDPDAITKTGKGAWIAYQITASSPWAAGKWAYRVTVTGAYSNVEYGNFTLKA